MAADGRDVEPKLDESILKALPNGGTVVSVTTSGCSDYCKTFCIEVSFPDGASQAFFQKEAKGQYGRELMEAAFWSESATHRFAPEYVPRPVKLGTYESDPNTHFFLADFVEMLEDEVPKPGPYMAAVVTLHQRSMGQSPERKFGFAVNTRFGDLEQPNHWDSSWEGFWTWQMRDFIDREERLRGPHDAQAARLVDLFLEKVLPRYLRPLETEGRSIAPCLIHADLWPGNVKYRTDGTTVCLYDASALWGHNEVDLGVFSNPRYPLGDAYLEEYWQYIPRSEPVEDADSRNIIYMTRNQILLASLYPSQPGLRDVWIGSIRLLVERVLEEEAKTPADATAIM